MTAGFIFKDKKRHLVLFAARLTSFAGNVCKCAKLVHLQE